MIFCYRNKWSNSELDNFGSIKRVGLVRRATVLIGGIYRRSSGYDGLDLRCFEVTKVPYKNMKDNNIEAVKLDYCDQELQ